MSKYEGLYTFDVGNHRYIPVGQADGIIDCFKFKHESKEPLIKDEKIRKAVRAWAEANDLSQKLRVINEHFDSCKVLGREESHNACYGIEFKSTIAHADKDRYYTIAELCGEEEE